MNNTIINHLFSSIRTTIVLAVLTGIIFPLIIYALAHMFFPDQAEGSLLHNKDGIVIGSKLIGQNFCQPQYFHPRPSAAGTGYDATASGGTNLGPTSKKLLEGVEGSFSGVKQLSKQYRRENNLSSDIKIPVDAVTYSASGLDPHISVQNAILQARRVANSRHITFEAVIEAVQRCIDHQQFGFLGERGVNVLALNLLLDRPHSKLKIFIDNELWKAVHDDKVEGQAESAQPKQQENSR